MIHDAGSMFHSPRCVMGVSLFCNMPRPTQKTTVGGLLLVSVSWGGGIQRKKLVSILEYASGPFGVTCNTFFASGSVDAQRMGRPFKSIQFQLHEELIIRQAMLENQNFHKCTGQIFVCLIPICWCFWRRV